MATAATDMAALSQTQSGVVVCTGAAGGMGRAAALAFGRQGRDLILCDLRDTDEVSDAILASSPAGGSARVTSVIGDVSDPDFPDRVVAALDGRRIAVVAHAAGVSPSFPGGGRRIFDINFTAARRLVEGLRPHMERGTGAFVLIASLSGAFVGGSLVDWGVARHLRGHWSPIVALMRSWSLTSYAISKRCLQMYVQLMATTLAREDGVRIVSISPGVIDTPMMAEFSTQPALKTFVGSAGQGRMGRAEEVASVVEFLASPGASYVTGVDLLVDGGLTSQKGHAIWTTLKEVIRNPPKMPRKTD